MARGNDAKKLVIEKIKEAFGSDYIDTVDGKVYVWAKENGEKLQIAISLTCPKNLINTTDSTKTISAAALDFGGAGGWDFEAMDQKQEIPQKSEEITEEEKNNIQEMMMALGLI